MAVYGIDVGTVAVSVGETDSGRWSEAGRRFEISDALAALMADGIGVKGAGYGLASGITVRLAVLDDGRMLDTVTAVAR